MRFISQYVLTLCIVLSSSLCSSQNTETLVAFLNKAESKFSVNFSYSDQALEGHIIQEDLPKSLPELISLLEVKSLFNYTILKEKNIAISLKDNLQLYCGELLTTDNESDFFIEVTTPFQRITVKEDKRFEFLAIANDDFVNIQSAKYLGVSLNNASFSKNSCLQIPLYLKLENLAPVKVRQFLAKGISKEADGSLKVNYAEFELLPGLIEPDVLQTLKALPGIQSANESISFLNIRGGTNDQNLILWDGIKMYQNSHFFGLISAFNPYFTQEVQLYKNGTPAQWGDGVSGVIDMHTKERVSREFSGGAGLNLLSGDVFVDIPLGEKASVQFAARKSINSVVNTPTFDAYFTRAFQNSELTNDDDIIRDNVNFSFFDTSLRLLYEPSEKDQLRFNLIFLANALDFNENVEINQNRTQRTSQLVQNNFSSTVWYQRKWNDRLSTEAQFYSTNYVLESLNEDIPNNQSLLQNNDVLETNFRIQTNYDFSEDFTAQLGYQVNETGITNSEEINNPFFERFDKQVLRTQSVFSQVQWNISPKTLLIGGVRANYIGKFEEFLIEPRLNFRQSVGKKIVLELQGEMKHQTTSQIVDLQEDFLGIENRRWILSSPSGNIPIIKSQQISGGATYTADGWLVSTEGYYKEVDGVTSQGQGFLNQFVNARSHGSYETYGAEMLVNKRFKNVNTWLSYVYAKNNFLFEDFIPSQFPNNVDIRHSLTYGINYNLKKFTFSAGFNWRSGIPTTLLASPEIVDNELNFMAPNSSNLEDYFRVDFSGTYKFPITNKVSGFLGFSFWNLLNTQNIINHFFILENESVRTVDTEALRFTPNFTARINF